MYPIEECSRVVLYQCTHSAVAASTAARFFQVAPFLGCSITSVLYRPIVDSINALSSASPTLPIDPEIPASANASVNARDVYCDPGVGMVHQSGGGELRIRP